MLEVCEWSRTRPCRHFFYGGAPGVAELLRDKLTERFPGLQVAGCYTPPFRPLSTTDLQSFQEQIHCLQPDILWVGLSTPKQEKFMAQYLTQLEVTLMVGVGAAFDFHCGRIKQAPRWIQRSGLEWFYRLCSEPRRLAGRYLRNNPRFVWKVLGQLSGMANYSLDRVSGVKER
jgi:N-acetylglucosaminyldiphosphoundecaprenol N-acetyl-beta-D-mannosaminyltransferase